MKVHVLGGTWIRAQLDATGGGAVPVYLDEALAERMPLFRRFAVRLIAEVHLAQDQFEAHPHALRAIAVAREAPAAVR
jgi:1,6-anhydro-N-acetylmuramate kinase